VGDDRSEDVDGSADDSCHAGELQHDGPEPAPGDELAPSLAHLVQRALSRRGWLVRQPHSRTQGRCDREARRIHLPARPGQADQDAAERGAGDPCAVAAGAGDGVGLRTLVLGNGLRQQALRCRQVQARADAADGDEDEQLPDARFAD
jgi:hypothetical protein